MMKKGEIILLVLAILGVLFFSGCASEPATTNTQQPAVSAKVIASGCAWRPAGELPFGACDAAIGAYFNGANCVSMAGCLAEAEEEIPFASLEACLAACESSGSKTGEAKGAVKEFEVEAKQFVFVPETITVNEGDTVRLVVTSSDVDHGIGIPEFKVSLKVAAGKTETVEFVADKKGTYTMRCNVFCGTDHKNMKGTLIVQ